MYTLPETEQILMPLIFPLTQVTFSPLQSLNNLMHVAILKWGLNICVWKLTHSKCLPQARKKNIIWLKLQNNCIKSDEEASVYCLRGVKMASSSGYSNSQSKTGALYFLYLQPPKPSWQHLTLNSNESSHFSSLTVSGRQSCGTMREVNQIPVMVLTSGRGQGLRLEGARQGHPIGWEVSVLKETKVMGL